MGISRLGLRGVQGRFYLEYENILAAGWQNDVSVFVTTDQELEEYGFISQAPMLREWIGGRKVAALSENSVIVRNKTFEATIGIPVDDIRRDKSAQIGIRVNGLAGRAADHPHVLLTALIENPGNCYDGSAFFGTAHAEGASGTQVNAFTNSHISVLNVADHTAVTPAELINCALKVVEAMFAFKDDQGQVMNANAKAFTVMVPSGMWASAIQAFSLSQVLDGGQPRINPITNVNGYTFRVIVNPRLTAASVFYVFRTDGSAKPFVFQEELFETDEKDETFENNRVLFGVKAIRNVGPLFWQMAAKATLS